MSRKRPLQSVSSPRAKRYLNGALAAELQTLRISPHATQSTPISRNVFGGPPSSPFLASAKPIVTEPPPEVETSIDMGFGADFAESLSDTDLMQNAEPPMSPVVDTPTSSSSSMTVDEGVRAERNAWDDEVIIEEMDEGTENRLVVYRPPVRSSAQSLARLNACLPESRYLVRNSRADEWLVKEVGNERMKRKLALVPWRDVKKICEGVRSTAIPMPWKTEVRQPDNTMEIEEIS